jgi:sporulation protein YlmC with PRC-barrel domain
MYARASKMENLPVVSLQTGEAVAWVRQPVIDITNLAILAFQCDLAAHKLSAILTTNDIRQLAPDCLIIDSEDELAEPDDIIRLKPLIKSGYSPIDKSVVSDMGRKLGHVEDYSINLDTSHIQKLYIRPSLFRAWLGGSLTVDRTQIIDVTPHRIVVSDATIKSSVLQPDPVPEINP